MTTATFLIGYDVEHLDPRVTGRFLERAVELHREYQVPATFFVLGETLERNVAALARVLGDDLFDVQQHTYTHKPLKTLVQRNEAGTQLIAGGSLDRVREEVTRTSDLLERALGVRCTGLTGPYGYYRGMSDRPDILEVLWDCGIRFLRTDARDQDDWQPVPFDLQPYRYELQGYPQMLEFGIQGWADCLLREQLGWADHASYLAEVERGLDLITERGLAWSYVQHDWSSLREDPDLALTESILRAVRLRGIRTDTYIAYAARDLPRVRGSR